MCRIIWENLSSEEREIEIAKIKCIKSNIRKYTNQKVNKIRANLLNDDEILIYDKLISDEKNKYNKLNIYSICPQCNNEYKLDIQKLRSIISNPNKKIFCSSKCCAQYIGNEYKASITDEDRKLIAKKISKTLNGKHLQLSVEDKEKLSIRSKNYWNSLTKEERSIRNKKSVLKAKQTKLNKYGNANYNNKVQAKQTYSQRYKYTPTENMNHLTEDILKIIRNKSEFKSYILNLNQSDRCIYIIAKNLGISRSYCSTLINRYKLYDEIDISRSLSQPQEELHEYIQSIYTGKIETNNRQIIKPLEIDIYIPEKQLAIEYNGNYWHCAQNKDKYAHYKKSKLCEEKGIRLIHIFEYEWENERQKPILENIIQSALGITKTLYARQLDIEERPSASMKDFFNKNNIQGFRGGKTAICLVDKKTREVYMSYILGSAYFGKGKYEWEVIRGATKLGFTIVGGASRIWKYFIKTYNPQNCVYYIDYNYFNGNSLKNLPNMKYIKTQFSFKNYWVKTGLVKNREPLRHKQIKELELNGEVYPIYNAGTKVYLWENT